MGGRFLRLMFGVGASALALTMWLAAPSSADTAPTASTASAPVNVSRPIGQVVLTDIAMNSDGDLAVTVVDTRENDPGWTVTVSGSARGWTPVVDDHSSAFTTADGTAYSQEVNAGASDSTTLGSAPRGHGLGIAHLRAHVRDGVATVFTVTVI